MRLRPGEGRSRHPPATLATGDILSKDAAADWALARLAPEHQPVLAFARDMYMTTCYADETWSDALKARVAPHVDEVLAQICLLQASAAVCSAERNGMSSRA